MASTAPAGYSRADLHVHTSYSDGTNTPEDVLNFYALHAGIEVFAITDHDTLDGAHQARRFAAEHPDLFGHLELIVGEEMTTRDGHVIGLFLQEWIPPGLSAADTVRAIHAQGGVAIAPHPYTRAMRWAGLLGVGDLIDTLPFDAVETRNANFTEVFANRKAARHLNGAAPVGNSDGHFLDAIGRCFTEFPGRTAAELRRAVHDRTTVAGGRCYGAVTLLRFCAMRLRHGGSIFPRRHDMRRTAAGGGLEIRIHELSSLEAAVLTPVGRIDERSMPELKETLLGLARARVGVVVDLAEVRLLSSAGITALIAGFKAAGQHGVGFCIAQPSAPCLQSLGGARLLTVLPRAASVAEARRRIVRDVDEPPAAPPPSGVAGTAS